MLLLFKEKEELEENYIIIYSSLKSIPISIGSASDRRTKNGLKMSIWFEI